MTKAPLNGIEVSYQDFGKPGCTPIVLIHAYPMNQLMWESQIPALAEDYRIISYDVRGMGQTTATPFPFTLEILVDDLIALLDHLKITQAVLCGISMGGYISLRTVMRNPERVRGLILCDTMSLADQNIGRLHRHEALQTIQEQGVPAYAEGFSKKVLADWTLQQQPEIVARIKKIVSSHSPFAVSCLTLALVSRFDTTEALAKISVPTLILVGDNDKLIPMENIQLLKDKIPNAELAVLPKAGHMSNVENPEEFNSQLLRFMKKHF